MKESKCSCIIISCQYFSPYFVIKWQCGPCSSKQYDWWLSHCGWGGRKRRGEVSWESFYYISNCLLSANRIKCVCKAIEVSGVAFINKVTHSGNLFSAEPVTCLQALLQNASSGEDWSSQLYPHSLHTWESLWSGIWCGMLKHRFTINCEGNTRQLRDRSSGFYFGLWKEG